MTLSPCLVCGEPAERGRCPKHYVARPQRLDGYDRAWRSLSLRARRLQPFCSDCGAVDDLSVDHSPEAWERKAAGLAIRLEDVDVVCRACNSARGQARPHGGTYSDNTQGGASEKPAPQPNPTAQAERRDRQHRAQTGGRPMGNSINPSATNHPDTQTRGDAPHDPARPAPGKAKFASHTAGKGVAQTDALGEVAG